MKKPARVVTQGFIGRTADGRTTTLGREGSDFSAAIFAYLLDAENVTIWKDVPGMFNADPKRFPDTTLLAHISYREAIELSYFGASVIHPRTLQRRLAAEGVRGIQQLGPEGQQEARAQGLQRALLARAHAAGPQNKAAHRAARGWRRAGSGRICVIVLVHRSIWGCHVPLFH